MDDVANRLAACERRNHTLSTLVTILTAAVLLMLTATIVNCVSVSNTKPAPQTAALPSVQPLIRAQMIEIVDPNGVVRARLGDGIPDAVIKGKRIGRQGQRPAGLMLYDATGTERGGYVTFAPSGNVLLTLDGSEKQATFFMAEPDGTVALRVWYGPNAVELRADEDGARFDAITAKGLVFQQPPIADPAATAMCKAYREYKGRMPADRLFGVCRDRMSDEACRACLTP